MAAGMMERVLIIGTGLIGASTGLALRAAGFTGRIDGWDQSLLELRAALEMSAIDHVAGDQAAALELARQADVILLAVPVLAIKDWMKKLAEVTGPGQLITDVGSTKLEITELAADLFGRENQASFLAGHPMAGKESGGALLAEASLFQGAMWLFTPGPNEPSAMEKEWRCWVSFFGTRTLDMDARRHDEMCAWVSHLPQMLSTAFAALLEEKFGSDEMRRDELNAIGGRALREMTRLGASPFSMWRDIATTNTENISRTIHELQQRLLHLSENLRTDQLREEFRLANQFGKLRE